MGNWDTVLITEQVAFVFYVFYYFYFLRVPVSAGGCLYVLLAGSWCDLLARLLRCGQSICIGARARAVSFICDVPSAIEWEPASLPPNRGPKQNDDSAACSESM